MSTPSIVDRSEFVSRFRKQFQERQTTAMYWRTGGTTPGESPDVELTYRELGRRAADLAESLVRAGVRPGDRVAILGESRPEWVVTFFGALFSGATVVPLDPKLSAAELLPIVRDCAPRLLFVSPQLRHAGEAVASGYPVALGDFGATPDLPVASSEPRPELEETALIVYTSGTTRDPKGVMIGFAGLMFECDSFSKYMKVDSRDTFLSILPLNHLFELAIGLLGVLHAGGAICYTDTLYPASLAQVMKRNRITRMLVVPLFLNMMKLAIEKQAQSGHLLSRAAFKAACSLAQRVPSRTLKRVLFRRVHQAFGGLQSFISGGAPLKVEVAAFFERIGISVFEGYGLTETGPVISVNTPERKRLGSVGRAAPGTEMKILSSAGGQGEILTRGPHLMQGYFNAAGATAAVLDDEGWFHTGDVGRLDGDGYLYVIGRLKSIIVLGSGKKVHPEEVEAAIAESPLIKEVCVAGMRSRSGVTDGAERVCAVVVPSEKLSRLPGDDGAVHECMTEEIQRWTSRLASFKRPTEIVLWPGDLPKTPTRKVKRGLILRMLEEMPRSTSDPGVGSERGSDLVSAR